jgi:hypothetical protein
MHHHRNGSAVRTRHSHPSPCHHLVGRRVRTKLQEACAAEGVGARQADGLVEGLEADGALWHCRSVWISTAGEAGFACSSSTAAEAWHALGSHKTVRVLFAGQVLCCLMFLGLHRVLFTYALELVRGLKALALAPEQLDPVS